MPPRRATGIAIHFHDHEVEVDELLVATGREPNSDLLDAERGGIGLHHHGTIIVDEHMQTGVDGVWAIGDIANEYQLKHVANAEAEVAFWNIAHPDELRAMDYKAVPAAVFSSPQVATVGATEQQARAAGRDVVVGRREHAVLQEREGADVGGAELLADEVLATVEEVLEQLEPMAQVPGVGVDRALVGLG